MGSSSIWHLSLATFVMYMSKKLTFFIDLIVIFVLFMLIVFTALNSFPPESYVPVHKKWFLYGKVVPPKDYNANILRKVDLDLLAPKENSEKGDFYWLQTSGDLITLTNRNFKSVTGTWSFNLETDPCGIERSILIGTKEGSIQVQTVKSKQTKVDFEVKLNSNSSAFLSIVGSPVKPCRINEGIDRSFLAKISKLEFNNVRTNE
jgi:hypothetical protein